MKISLWFLLLFSLFFVASCENNKPGSIIAVDVDNNDDNKDGEAIVHSFVDKEELDVFQPTAEWQDVKEGQAIPPGLHVQMDMKTGRKQAKLMDGDDGKRYLQQEKAKNHHEKTKYFKKANQGKAKFVKIDKNIFSKQQLKDALKDFKDKFHDERPEAVGSEDEKTIKNKFRSIDEIRKDLEGANLFPKKDIEFIQDYIAILNKTTSTIEEKEHVLVELEYLLHQTDNAVDFSTIGGLEMIVKLLNSTEERLVSKAAFVLGSSAQSNLPVQKAAQKYGALPLLLRLLTQQQPMSVRRKALFALSSIIRVYSNAQQEFLKLNGMQLFYKLMNEPGIDVLKVKVVTLMTDILTEQFDHVRHKVQEQNAKDMEEVLKEIPLLKAMVKQGWCQMLQNQLQTTENDTREKVLQALNVMVVGCREEFKNSEINISLNQLHTELQENIKTTEGNEGDYFVQLSQLVTDLKNKLN